MILLDGTRQDRIELSKELSLIAKEGIYFSNMITAAPYTVASMHAILSGIYPTKNGVNAYYNMLKFKKESCKTLPEYLKSYGYYTFADIGNDSYIPHQGFDKVSVYDVYKDDLIKRHTDVIKGISKSKPFFIFCHYDKIVANLIVNVAKKHTDFSEEYFNNKEKNIKRYNNYLKEAGIYAKEILNSLKAEGLSKDTIVIFFSDHGISNGEKVGEKMYGSFLYDYTLKVFSIIYCPEKNSKTITHQTRTIDLMPTILDLLNIPLDKDHEKVQGKSLIPFIEEKENEDRIAFCETGGLNGPWPSPKKHNVKAIRYKNWKLIYNMTPDTKEVYDLKEDPLETNNLAGKGLTKEKELWHLLKKESKTEWIPEHI